MTWTSDERCVVAGITFQAMPPDFGDSNRSSISMQGADFLLFKPRPLIERYVEWIEELRPRNSSSSAISKGAARRSSTGSHARTVWTPSTEAARGASAADFVAREGLDEELRVHTDVDQSDRGRIRRGRRQRVRR